MGLYFEKSLYKGEVIREYLHKRLTSYATDIDNFLSNEPNSKVYTNPSYIHIKFSTEKVEGDKLETKATVKVRLKLPKLKNKYRIEFGNKKEINDKSNDIRVDELDTNEDYHFGISYIDNLKDYLSISAGAGVRVKLDEFDPYIRLKASRDFAYYGNWKGEFIQEFYYSHKNNLEATSSYEVFKVFSKKLKFSNYNEYYWTKEEENDNNFYNSIRLYQNISKKNYLSYVVSASTNDENGNLKVENYQTYVSYRHYIKEWLYYEVIPRIIWERDNDFDEKFALRFNLGMFVGKK